MIRKYWLLISLIPVMTNFLPSATAAALDPAYLAGKWEINTQGVCGDKDAEHLILRDNKTLEYGRRGKAEAVGFWRIEDDVVVLEMLTAPATFKDIHAELEAIDGYDIYRMQMMPVDRREERFSAVAGLGDLMERLSLQRCR